jgi:acetylornithine deacetylase
VSAIEKLAPVQRAVLALEAERNGPAALSALGADGPLFGWLERPFAICGGRVEGGDWPSSEADWLTWEGRYGVAPGEDLAAARAQFEEAVASVCVDDAWLAEHPPTVEWWGGQFLPARTDASNPIVTATHAAARAVAGGDVPLRGMPYGCDAGLTVGVGEIPTVVFGPGDIRDAHVPDESVPVADLVASARTLALTALRFCGTAG